MPTATVNIPSQVLTYANLAAFPVSGVVKTIYIAEDTEKTYRWNGSAYVEISQGSTSGVQSVTGDGVDNTDPLNPVLTYPTPNDIGAEPAKGVDDNYVTDAQLVVIQNTSGTNTGDNATNTTSNAYADSKITQVITNGVTDKSPSEDAVYDALQLKANLSSPTFTGTPAAPTAAANTNTTQIATTEFVQTALSNRTVYIYKDYADSATLTGNTNNTLMFSQEIPANTFAVGDFIEMWSRVRKSGDGGTVTVRLYFNTSASLSGATLVATLASTNTTDSVDLGRIMIVKSATNTEVTSATSSSISRDNTVTNAISNNNIDWTVKQYFIVAAQNSVNGDSSIYSGSMIRKN